MQHRNQHATIASWWINMNHISPTIKAAAMPRRKCRRESQKAPKTMGRVFSSNYTTPGLPFAVVPHTNTQKQQLPHLQLVPLACPATVGEMRTPPTVQHHQQQETGQSPQAFNINSASLNNMFRVTTAVQQIMTELNGAMSEEGNIVAITKIVLNLMKKDGC
jgi:hypothetical protein